MFNQDTNINYNSEIISKLKQILNKTRSKTKLTWVFSKYMTKQEKESNPSHKTTGGFLRINSKVNSTVMDASKLTEDDIKFIRNLPNFNNEIFKKCTGVDLANV